jgi:hypothetical protein
MRGSFAILQNGQEKVEGHIAGSAVSVCSGFDGEEISRYPWGVFGWSPQPVQTRHPWLDLHLFQTSCLEIASLLKRIPEISNPSPQSPTDTALPTICPANFCLAFRERIQLKNKHNKSSKQGYNALGN